MKMAMQATKTAFLTLSGSKISVVVTAIAPKNEVDYGCEFSSCTWSMLTSPGITETKYPLGK